jgi:hypothetical protein
MILWIFQVILLIILRIIHLPKPNTNIDVSKPSSENTPQGSVESTPVKKKYSSNKNDSTPVDIPVYVNYVKCKGRCYVIYVSGLVFDNVKNDDTISSNELIDIWCDDYESIHKVNLPMPNGPTNYRQLFLRNGGYDTDGNLQLLKYPKFVTFHLEGGNMDIAKFTLGTDYVSRRYPLTMIHLPNLKNSNAPEFNLDLKDKFEVLLQKLKKNQFLISAKSNLNKRMINYVFYESIIDVTEFPNSHEFKQMRLLLACCAAIKQKELNKMVNSSFVKEEIEDTNSVPLVTLKRNSDETLKSSVQMDIDSTLNDESNDVAKETSVEQKQSPALNDESNDVAKETSVEQKQSPPKRVNESTNGAALSSKKQSKK